MDSLRIIVIDDEEPMRNSLLSILTKKGHSVTTAATGHEALTMVQKNRFDAALLDLRMPKMDGLQLLRRLKEDHPDLVVIVMTGFSSVESAVEAMRYGAFDYVRKPFEVDELEITLQRGVAQQRLSKTEEIYREQAQAPYGLDRLVGRSAGLENVREMIRTVADADTTVLVTGESGTGKELVAGAIHLLSPRRKAPFIAVNCGAIASTLLESELFGHIKGAFTGAESEKKGLFESADRGTLFLDEVGEIPPQMQVQLLRAIERQEIKKVGASHTTQVNTRIIASTNRDLPKAVDEGGFRPDLYYRLNIFPIEVPPLRERREDILLLVEHFLDFYATQLRRPRFDIPSWVAEQLLRYHWPGNVRELENMVERAVLLGKPEALVPDEPEELEEAGLYSLPLKEARDNFEKRYLVHILKRQTDNITDVARRIGIHRTTLYDLLKKHGVEASDLR